MFMVMLAESQPVSLPLGTEDEKPLLFFPLKWALFTEDATEISDAVTLEFLLTPS